MSEHTNDPTHAAGREASAAPPGNPGRLTADPTGQREWEHGVLEHLVLGTLTERRRRRRWSIFFKLAALAWLTVALLVAGGWIGSGVVKSGPDRHTALVELDGVISAKTEASADNVIAALKSAFEDKRTAGVVLRINSPGGSPVQSGIIYDEIRRLRAMHPDTPLYAVVDEICASGGYYIAAAADEIYVDKASLVGSIGVLINGFGATEVLDRLGIERRLFKAGEDKAFLDPFSPMLDRHRERAQQMIDEIHRQFIDAVRKGRADRINDDPELFTGMVWTGARSIELGLADALGTLDSVARDIIKVEEVVDFSTRESLTERLARRVGAGAVRALMDLGLLGTHAGWSIR